MAKQTYLVTVPARGHQSYMVENAASKADAIRKAMADPCGMEGDVEAFEGDLDILSWSMATAENVDRKRGA